MSFALLWIIRTISKKFSLPFSSGQLPLAFDHFREEKIDVGIIEVGLGGRLDSTNIITPILSVITNVSFDHQQFLGNTIEAIAAEKAGIIKDHVPVVVGETQQETKPVFTKYAGLKHAPILFADEIFKSQVITLPSQKSHHLVMNIFRGQAFYIKSLKSPLAGLYQKKNIVTVIAACELLQSLGFNTGQKQVSRGIRNVIRNTGLQGRWQILSQVPLTICDTGHNVGGLSYVLEQISVIPYRRLHFVFGLVNDKEFSTILKTLPKNAIYYFCKADIPRGMDAKRNKKTCK